jgi:hypothetical protein
MAQPPNLNQRIGDIAFAIYSGMQSLQGKAPAAPAAVAATAPATAPVEAAAPSAGTVPEMQKKNDYSPPPVPQTTVIAAPAAPVAPAVDKNDGDVTVSVAAPAAPAQGPVIVSSPTQPSQGYPGPGYLNSGYPPSGYPPSGYPPPAYGQRPPVSAPLTTTPTTSPSARAAAARAKGISAPDAQARRAAREDTRKGLIKPNTPSPANLPAIARAPVKRPVTAANVQRLPQSAVNMSNNDQWEPTKPGSMGTPPAQARPVVQPPPAQARPPVQPPPAQARPAVQPPRPPRSATTAGLASRGRGPGRSVQPPRKMKGGSRKNKKANNRTRRH